ncbi:uncharacterized protein LOC127279907 [Leptopilina boulardi]|uniref:uncharacterized protein LOC127279907 n=1 Tax=Leptopilina boulardi TaxID=63433 RepID=UPI0021F68AC2|nr:uncharacterized protein LOC127279907 [Leptopilina boulardi]
MFSKYFHTLQGDVKRRYLEKIKDINNCDPYAIKESDLSANLKELVPIEVVDLYRYLLSTRSCYTEDEVKAFKSLEAFKFLVAGFVQKILFIKINDKYVVRGEVKHSQRMNASNLQVWIKIFSSGTISTAHCTCMAGLGEVCSHVAAILFALELGLLTDETSCTGKLAL